MRKVICDDHDCFWTGVEGEILHAPNPFDPNNILNGCPLCRQINTIVYACDEPDCWCEATCGTPIDDGYRQTCGGHRPK